MRWIRILWKKIKIPTTQIRKIMYNIIVTTDVGIRLETQRSGHNAAHSKLSRSVDGPPPKKLDIAGLFGLSTFF